MKKNNTYLVIAVLLVLSGCGTSSISTEDDYNTSTSNPVNTGGSNSSNTSNPVNTGGSNSSNTSNPVNTGGSNSSNTFNPDDYDNDGIVNAQDNCPGIYNPNQTDENNNKIGDICETESSKDIDGDGISDRLDNCITKKNPDQKDSDKDGFGDICDKKPNETHQQLIAKCRGNKKQVDWNKLLKHDSDADGLPDACEKSWTQDMDNDGIINAQDNCVKLANRDQTDSDSDKIGDACDAKDDYNNPLPKPVINNPFDGDKKKYRYQTTYLFQDTPGLVEQTAIKGEKVYAWKDGANKRFVDNQTGWLWDNEGGDYLDKQGSRQGTKAWFTFKADKVVGIDKNYRYHIDVTDAVKYIQEHHRWNALLLKSKTSINRKIAGKYSSTPPTLTLSYTDGTQETMNIYYSSSLNAVSRSISAPGIESQILPIAMEFARPTKAVSSAQLELTVVGHKKAYTYNQPYIYGFIIDPPVNSMPVKNGLSQQYTLDQGIEKDPDVLGAHHYIDGSSIEDFVSFAKVLDTDSIRPFDPAIYGIGAQDLTKLPHLDNGKWFNAKDDFSLVDSTYTAEGFKPLLPGLGAMKVTMPDEGIHHGYLQAQYRGSKASAAKIYLPEKEFGKLDHIFIRYYIRLGTPYFTPRQKHYQVYKDATDQATWNDFGGKFGIVPNHTTSFGGFSGSSGGGRGWQMRLAWRDTLTGVGGPNENAMSLGLHTWDFHHNNPKGYNYATSAETNDKWNFNQKGGLGGVIYPGKWYEIEMEVKLNTIIKDDPSQCKTYTGSKYYNYGDHINPAKKGKQIPYCFKPDGEVRVWIDGRLAFERGGMVMRTWPLHTTAQEISQFKPGSALLPPVRDLGIREIMLNWFHGGLTFSSVPRTTFFTGLVWSKKYIGPMKR